MGFSRKKIVPSMLKISMENSSRVEVIGIPGGVYKNLRKKRRFPEESVQKMENSRGSW